MRREGIRRAEAEGVSMRWMLGSGLAWPLGSWGRGTPCFFCFFPFSFFIYFLCGLYRAKRYGLLMGLCLFFFGNLWACALVAIKVSLQALGCHLTFVKALLWHKLFNLYILLF